MNSRIALIVFLGVLIGLTETNVVSAQDSENECESAFSKSRAEAESNKQQCILEVEADYQECMSRWWLIRNHSKACSLDRSMNMEGCLKVYTSEVELALSRLQRCRGMGNEDTNNTLVFVDGNSKESYLTNLLGIANSRHFEATARRLTKSKDLIVRLASEPINEQLLESVVKDRFPTLVNDVWVVGHGGDKDGDQKWDQYFGDKCPRPGSPELARWCKMIDEVTRDGGRVYLCGCQVGSNEELCDEIAELTNCFVYASPDNVKYDRESGIMRDGQLYIMSLPDLTNAK